MVLRQLELKDAPFMLEWMHDKGVVEDLQADFYKKSLRDCEKFILKSWEDEGNFHLAIADDTDIYMGTVSLKDIDMDRKQAEFAIVIRSCAMGKGLSKYAMEEMMRKGFEEMGLERIFWCVSPNNKRAIRFYEKGGYKRIGINDISSKGGYCLPPTRDCTFGISRRDRWHNKKNGRKYFSSNYLLEKCN